MTERLFTDTGVADNLARIRESIADACALAGRRQEDVQLIAVTKTVDAARINEAIAAGVHQIGENRVQEYCQKRPLLSDECGLVTHLIGHLQTNKVNQIVGKVDMIQSVDSFRLAERISRASVGLGIVSKVLIEVNIGAEEAKSGVEPDKLSELLEMVAGLPGICVRGLMTVAPILPSETEKRKVFSRMYQLFVDNRGKNMDNISMQELSMGMSGDYREAILEGATMVRIGSAIFGNRNYIK